MPAHIVIRPAKANEHASVQILVQEIADETFAHLFPYTQVPIGASDWSSAWLAMAEEEIVGVMMTRDEWVSDLWIRRGERRTGIGSSLLAHAEREIRSREYDTPRLRVVESNTRAVAFYRKHGWRILREFPHEKFGHGMFEMAKPNQHLG